MKAASLCLLIQSTIRGGAQARRAAITVSDQHFTLRDNINREPSTDGGSSNVSEPSRPGPRRFRLTRTRPSPVGGELDKLASNVAFGRNFAGSHWRCDAIEALRLVEKAALAVLRDMQTTVTEPFDGFRFTKFDGTLVTVG